MSPETLTTTSARDRLLEAANELFYEGGIHEVGIERVIERAGVAKATLYSIFGNKDGLIKAYLLSRHEGTRERIEGQLASRYQSPRERLVGVLEIQGEVLAEPGFRGCAFIGANAESTPSPSIEEATSDFRAWIHSLFYDLAVEANAPDPLMLSRQLVLLYDGAIIAAWMDHDAKAVELSMSIATALIQKEVPLS
jgi:AcrR family transcriptional regulator